jgi:hypothetical protein
LIFNLIEDWTRKDFYLKTAAPAKQSIKLREGNLEIKQRLKNLDALHFGIKQSKKIGGIVELKQIVQELPLALFKIKDSESYPSFLD